MQLPQDFDSQQKTPTQLPPQELTYKNSSPIIISGLWVRSNENNDGLEILVEVPRVSGSRRWKLCWSGRFNEAIVSQIIEPLGIRNSPEDDEKGQKCKTSSRR
jgi:hypothetical protein